MVEWALINIYHVSVKKGKERNELRLRRRKHIFFLCRCIRKKDIVTVEESLIDIYCELLQQQRRH